MKFYKDNIRNYFWNRISVNKLTAIHSSTKYVQFFKNGKYHNPNNADFIDNKGFKEFSLYDKSYGNHNDFTKHSWRRFVKLQIFL